MRSKEVHVKMVSGDIENEFGEIIAVEYAKVDLETGEVEYEVLELGEDNSPHPGHEGGEY